MQRIVNIVFIVYKGYLEDTNGTIELCGNYWNVITILIPPRPLLSLQYFFPYILNSISSALVFLSSALFTSHFWIWLVPSRFLFIGALSTHHSSPIASVNSRQWPLSHNLYYDLDLYTHHCNS